MDIRAISDAETDLPPNIIVVQADSCKSAFAAMASGLKKDGVNLAVWNGAQKLVPDEFRKAIQDISDSSLNGRVDTQRDIAIEKDRLLSYLAGDFRRARTEQYIHCHYAADIRDKKKQIAPDLLALWEDSTQKICRAVDELFGLTYTKLTTWFQAVAAVPDYHVDLNLTGTNKTLVLRTLSGPATLFVADKDRGRQSGSPYPNSYAINPDTERLWALEQGSIALLTQNKNTPEVVHTAPFMQPGINPRRTVEILAFTTRKPIV
ncbi:MAG TPA: hypothetical protein VIF12_01010 [Micavibrio sp.]